MTFNDKMNHEWVREVQQARRSILASKREPIKLLTDLFELYQGDFDITGFQTKQPKLYELLQQFCSTIPQNTTELKECSGELARFFNDHIDEIRKCDVDMYYALLNFMDLLKSKRIYFQLIQ